MLSIYLGYAKRQQQAPANEVYTAPTNPAHALAARKHRVDIMPGRLGFKAYLFLNIQMRLPCVTTGETLTYCTNLNIVHLFCIKISK